MVIVLRQRYSTGSAWCAICLLTVKGLTRAPVLNSEGWLGGEGVKDVTYDNSSWERRENMKGSSTNRLNWPAIYTS